MQDYSLRWKLANGYYDGATVMSDEECDWFEEEKKAHAASLALLLPKTEDGWRRAFGLLPPEPKKKVDKDEVKARVDMLDLIGRYGVQKIRHYGRRAAGLCPFHQEKTPSFSVDLEKKLWYCFSEGRGSDCFGFVMEAEDCSFVEAVRILNRQY
jgi:hypothetical protein